MSWIIGFLTFFLVVDCLFMILLILVQLPKKEAGMGTAFGGGATDALFGAGTGNALTKLTKYTATIFFVLTLGLSVLNAHQSRSKQSVLEKELSNLQQQTTPAVTPPVIDTNAVPAPQPGTPPPASAVPAPTNAISITLPATTPSTPPPTATPTPTPPATTPAPAPPAPAPVPAPAPKP